MELVVLGCDGSWPGPGGACSGYLVSHDGCNVWVDAGFGTIGRLQEHVALTDLDAVLISHGHRDHFADLYALFASRRYGRTPARDLPVFALKGFREYSGALISERSGDAWSTTFDWHEIGAGERIEVGPFSVSGHEMLHFGPALGFRIEAAGKVLAYTGDTGPTDALKDLASDADLLLAEATWQDGERKNDRHLTARDAASWASHAGARSLMLTHLEPGHDAQVSLAQASEEFRGEISLARPGLRSEVG